MFSSLESWVLPCSSSCVAELTHSSPGPMLPQSTTASLRTLEYSSAAVQGSRARGDKKTGYIHTNTGIWCFSSVPSSPASKRAIVRSILLQALAQAAYLSPHLHRNRIWLWTLCVADFNFSDLFKQEILNSCDLTSMPMKKKNSSTQS